MNKADAEKEAYLGLSDGWLFIHHPDLEDSYQKVTVAAFDEVYEERGWEKANDLLDEDGVPYSWNNPVDEPVVVDDTAEGGTEEDADEDDKE